MLGGERVKLQVAHTKLSHSKAFIVRAYLPQTPEMLFDALSQAFRVLGGVPRRGIFDSEAGKGLILWINAPPNEDSRGPHRVRQGPAGQCPGLGDGQPRPVRA